MVTGGPTAYSGLDMRKGHAHLVARGTERRAISTPSSATWPARWRNWAQTPPSIAQVGSVAQSVRADMLGFPEALDPARGAGGFRRLGPDSAGCAGGGWRQRRVVLPLRRLPDLPDPRCTDGAVPKKAQDGLTELQKAQGLFMRPASCLAEQPIAFARADDARRGRPRAAIEALDWLSASVLRVRLRLDAGPFGFQARPVPQPDRRAQAGPATIRSPRRRTRGR